MRRYPLVLGFVVITSAGIALSSQGCGPGEPAVEDLCGWLKDPENCYRKFDTEVARECLGGDTARTGSFLTRDKLDICVITSASAGQVIFDPPLDVTMFPVQSASFKFIGSTGLECGSASYKAANDGSDPFTFQQPNSSKTECAPTTIPGKEGFSVTVLANDAGTVPTTGGAFSSTPTEARDVFDISCPRGETHHFNRLHACYCQTDLPSFPAVELESSPGGIDVDGFVRLRINYPSGIVTYFDCAIPGAPKPCFNGTQDGLETDVDCGGPVTVAEPCPRCLSGQKCASDEDCTPNTCVTMMGIKTCGP